MDRLLTIEEVGALVGKTRRGVYHLVDRGVLPAVRLGRELRFNPTAIREWVEAGGTAPELRCSSCGSDRTQAAQVSGAILCIEVRCSACRKRWRLSRARAARLINLGKLKVEKLPVIDDGAIGSRR